MRYCKPFNLPGIAVCCLYPGFFRLSEVDRVYSLSPVHKTPRRPRKFTPRASVVVLRKNTRENEKSKARPFTENQPIAKRRVHSCALDWLTRLSVKNNTDLFSWRSRMWHGKEEKKKKRRGLYFPGK